MQSLFFRATSPTLLLGKYKGDLKSLDGTNCIKNEINKYCVAVELQKAATMKNRPSKYLDLRDFGLMRFVALAILLLASPAQAQKTAAEFADLGRAKLKSNDARGAITAFSGCIKLEPDKFMACWGGRAEAYEVLKENDKALSDYTNAIAVGEKTLSSPKLRAASALPTYYARRGRIYGNRGKTAEASKDFTTALTINQKIDGAFRMAGDVSLWRGDYKSAISYYDIAFNVAADLEMYPSRAEAYLKIGEFWAGFKDLDFYDNYKARYEFLLGRTPVDADPLVKADNPSPAPGKTWNYYDTTANEAFARGDYAAAIVEAAKGIRAFPTPKRAYLSEPLTFSGALAGFYEVRGLSYEQLGLRDHAARDNVAAAAVFMEGLYGFAKSGASKAKTAGKLEVLWDSALDEFKYGLRQCELSDAYFKRREALLLKKFKGDLNVLNGTRRFKNRINELCVGVSLQKAGIERQAHEQKIGTKFAAASLETLNDALKRAPFAPDIFTDRAKTYRLLGQSALAVADEKQAASLSKK